MLQLNKEQDKSPEQAVEKDRSEDPTKLSMDSEIIKDAINFFMAIRQFTPLVEPVAASLLDIYRDIKKGENTRELFGELGDDFLGFANKLQEISDKRNIESINAFKAAGISEDNAVAIICARMSRKLPAIKIGKAE